MWWAQYENIGRLETLVKDCTSNTHHAILGRGGDGCAGRIKFDMGCQQN